ncbi:MAG: glycosyltransferase family 4 protein [Acidimicrobiia bacterium]|nr:glycosyltransferase family 4 protein [Acidimicrobiia bacterium]
MSRPRVGCNLLWLVPSVVGGSEDYALGLLGGLAASDELDPAEVVLFVNRTTAATHPHLSEQWSTVVAPIEGPRRPTRVLAESTWLAHQAQRRGLGLVHHLGGLVPWYSPVPTVVTVHDLQPLVLAGNFSPLKQRYLASAIPASVRRARRVVALSHAGARDLEYLLGVDPERIVTIHPGRTPPDPRALDAEEARRVRARYELGDRPFFVLPAITWPHKNHIMLVEAFARLAERRPEPLLVLPGGEGPAEPALRAAVAAAGLGDRVRRLGRIPRLDLEVLLANAVALAFPSRFEGFGLPVVEAMGLRCPVLAAATTSLPEVVGDAGVLLSPDRPQEWTDAMEDLLDRPDHRSELASAGERRAAQFSWRTAARRTVELWHEELYR